MTKYIETGKTYLGHPLVINLNNHISHEPELGYLEETVRTMRTGLSGDGFRNEYQEKTYQRFQIVPWESRFNHLLPEGWTPPRSTKPKNKPPQAAPKCEVPHTHCEVCEAKFTPAPRYEGHPAHYRKPTPDPKNHRRVWDPTEKKVIHLCLECAQEWGFSAPPRGVKCDTE